MNKNWKRKWFGIRMGLGICAGLGWWGLIYPELALTPDTVKITCEEPAPDACGQSPVWSFDSGLYWDILNAAPDKITFRSKLLTDFNTFWEALHNGDKQ